MTTDHPLLSSIHWPTADAKHVWCACRNVVFDSAEEWQEHVVDAVLEEREKKVTPDD